jgi:hypothetical protein
LWAGFNIETIRYAKSYHLCIRSSIKQPDSHSNKINFLKESAWAASLAGPQ